MKALDELRATLPEYAKDLKINLQSVLTQSSLSETQVWAVATSVAISLRNEKLREATLADAAEKVSPEVIEDARAAASLMGMNNVYYRFRHFMGDSEYEKMRAQLRMHRIAKPAASKVDFELMSLALSAVEGCQLCVKSHEAVLRKADVTSAQVHDAVRIAAVFNGVAIALDQ